MTPSGVVACLVLTIVLLSVLALLLAGGLDRTLGQGWL